MGLFSKSKASLSKRSNSETSSVGTVSAPATPRSPYLDSDSSGKISVVSDASSPPPRSQYNSPAPATPAAPRCRVCSKPGTLRVTRSSNRNDNAGRPYYKCVQDDVFICFVDDRGDSEGNPECDCGVSSRRQLSSPQKGRKIFYKCKSGACDFFQFHQRADGTEWSVDDDVAKALAELKVV